ncbi:MAG: sulfurtransferase complex subunit TusC [Theionarchaea archaeon]|nr:sulfurtransferase complex subunit TusC [Theionarchaea archaeon]
MNLVIFRQAPYGTSYTGEGIRVLSSLGAFEVGCSVLFTDDGVFSLVKNQNPETLEMKSLGKVFESLLKFGIQDILVSEESLAQRGIQKEELIDVDVRYVNNKEVRRIMQQSRNILTF